MDITALLSGAVAGWAVSKLGGLPACARKLSASGTEGRRDPQTVPGQAAPRARTCSKGGAP